MSTEKQPNRSIRTATRIGQRLLGRIRGDTQPEVIYHYTTSVTLEKIVDSGELHATHYGTLNDPSEGHLIGTAWAEVVDTYLPDVLEELHAGQEGSEFGSHIRKVLLLSEPARIWYPFIIAFSEDSDSLPLWKEYADHGHGVALGLRPAWADFPDPHWDVGLTTLGPVRYDERSKADLFRNLFVDAIVPLFDDFRKCDRNEAEFYENSLETVLGFLEAVALSACFMKDAAYSYEREWRLVVAAVFPEPGRLSKHAPSSLAYRILQRDVAPLKVRFAGRRIVPYIPVPLRATGGTHVQSLVLGPSISTGLFQAAHEVFLRSRGWPDGLVTCSPTRYRAV